jgi:hypothetical protein
MRWGNARGFGVALAASALIVAATAGSAQGDAGFSLCTDDFCSGPRIDVPEPVGTPLATTTLDLAEGLRDVCQQAGIEPISVSGVGTAAECNQDRLQVLYVPPNYSLPSPLVHSATVVGCYFVPGAVRNCEIDIDGYQLHAYDESQSP